MRINQNISAMNTYSRLTSANNSKSKSLEKLSSGLRINRAGDDAAGLAISEKMRGQIGGLNQAVRNAQDGISLIQTAEGALTETHSMLGRMRDLAVQSANGTNTKEDREEIQKEVDQLAKEITRIQTDTNFNTQNLLDGTFNDMKFHIGANSGQSTSLSIENMGAEALKVGFEATEDIAGEDAVEAEAATGTVGDFNITAANGKNYTITIAEAGDADEALTSVLNEEDNTITITLASDNAGDIDSTLADVQAELEKHGLEVEYTGADDTALASAVNGALADGTEASEATREQIKGEMYGIDVSTQEAADAAITIIDAASASVSSERSKLGAVQNRLDHTINNLTATSENLSAAESRIRDVDMAQEMMEFTKNNILSQAATSMLAQANMMPQSVLQLLQ